MLEIHIPKQEYWLDDIEEFVTIKEIDLQLEHSLYSLAKWESKWHKPFLGNNEKTEAEIKDYIRCMTITKNVPSQTYDYLSQDILKEVLDYVDNPMTATWFTTPEEKPGAVRKKEVITAEIIYYWMVSLNVPLQCEKWHLNRLITLIRVINVKNAPKKKMSKKDLLARNAKLNAERRAKFNSKG